MVIVGLALLLQLGSWLQGGLDMGESFARYRVLAHLRPEGIALLAILGILAFAIAPRPERAGFSGLAIGALAVHLLFLDIPQGQPDTANWFVLAQLMERAPLYALTHWKELVWDVPQGRYHLYLPLVPALYGAAFRLFGESPRVADLLMSAFAIGLPLSVAWAGQRAGEPLNGLRAGWLLIAGPYLQAQSGWLLADIPLSLFLCLTWGALLGVESSRAGAAGPFGRLRPYLPAIGLSLLALTTKSSALLYVPALWAAVLLRRKHVFFLSALAVLVALLLLRPPHADRPRNALAAILITVHQTGPALWVLALASLLGSSLPGRPMGVLERTSLASLALLPLLALYRPTEHVARYALPLVPVMALAAARFLADLPRTRALLVSVGLGLLVLGYRPLLTLNQARNLQIATRRLEATGVDAIEVWGDHPTTTFPASTIAAFVDFYATIPVVYGGTLRMAPTGERKRWWSWYEPPAWHIAGDHPTRPQGVLLSLFGAGPERFMREHPDLELISRLSIYRNSSALLPQEVALLRRGMVEK